MMAPDSCETMAARMYFLVRGQRVRHRNRSHGADLECLAMDSKLLDILACPLCKGPLQYQKALQLLVCRADRLAFPIRDGIPVMLEEEARQLEPTDPLLRA